MLFKALTIGPAYLIFPIVALSPGITVLMATFLLRERLLMLTKVGIVLALVALVFFNISGDTGDAASASKAAGSPKVGVSCVFMDTVAASTIRATAMLSELE